MDVSESGAVLLRWISLKGSVARVGVQRAGGRAGRGGGRRVRGQNGPHGTYSSRLRPSVRTHRLGQESQISGLKMCRI